VSLEPETNAAVPTSASASAAQLDAADPVRSFRDRFELPDGIYLVGNSLGALPRATRDTVLTELDRWSTLGVEGHFTGELAWKNYHELVTDSLANLTGANADEVVAMNSLTVNLHLLLVSFYQPTKARHKILIEDHAFPSDHFAAESQIRQRGFDPDESLVVVKPRPGEETLRTEDLLAAIEEHGPELALVLLPGVQYYTGQVLPMPALVEAAHAAGAVIGFDLAHAIGNIELDLHRWGADFAVWCTYKYLNSGPGGVGGAFVHRRHVADQTLPKLLGWWGTNKATRFQMANEFDAIPTVESWQLSNAPILALAALRASLELFEQAGGMTVLRAKSEQQIAYFDRRLTETLAGRVDNATPREMAQRGCQYALQVVDQPGGPSGKEVFAALTDAGVLADWREPNVIRVAPVPLYNSFADIDQFVTILDGILS
jgi:kynureninase